MTIQHSLRLTGKQIDITVMLQLMPSFPFNYSNIRFVTVPACSLGEAGKIAKEGFSGAIVMNYYF